MGTQTSSIDELLVAGTTSLQPATPEDKEIEEHDESADSYEQEAAPEPEQDFQHDYIDKDEEEEQEALSEDEPAIEVDDYGNPKAKPKMYTEDEVNERINKTIRERLRQRAEEQQNQAVPPTINNTDVNPEDWQGQLESFVEQTIGKLTHKQLTAQQQAQERAAYEEFHGKFQQGMARFNDFHDVVKATDFDDPMAQALRGIKDPAAFAYAAAKRHPEELARIRGIKDPYAKMVEIGKLEERMKKTQAATKAPKPVSRTVEDATSKPKSKTNTSSIDDLIAHSDAKRLAKAKQLRSNR